MPYIGYTHGILLRKNLRRRLPLFNEHGRSFQLPLGLVIRFARIKCVPQRSEERTVTEGIIKALNPDICRTQRSFVQEPESLFTVSS